MEVRPGKLLVRPVNDGRIRRHCSSATRYCFSRRHHPVSPRQSTHGPSCECWPTTDADCSGWAKCCSNKKKAYPSARHPKVFLGTFICPADVNFLIKLYRRQFWTFDDVHLPIRLYPERKLRPGAEPGRILPGLVLHARSNRTPSASLILAICVKSLSSTPKDTRSTVVANRPKPSTAGRFSFTISTTRRPKHAINLYTVDSKATKTISNPSRSVNFVKPVYGNPIHLRDGRD